MEHDSTNPFGMASNKRKYGASAEEPEQVHMPTKDYNSPFYNKSAHHPTPNIFGFQRGRVETNNSAGPALHQEYGSTTSPIAPFPAASRVYPPHRFMEQGMGWSTIGVDAQAESPSPSTSLQSSADGYHSGGVNENLTAGYPGQFYNQDRGFAPTASLAPPQQTNPFGFHPTIDPYSVMPSPSHMPLYDGPVALGNGIYPLQGLAGSPMLLPPNQFPQGDPFNPSPYITRNAGGAEARFAAYAQKFVDPFAYQPFNNPQGGVKEDTIYHPITSNPARKFFPHEVDLLSEFFMQIHPNIDLPTQKEVEEWYRHLEEPESDELWEYICAKQIPADENEVEIQLLVDWPINVELRQEEIREHRKIQSYRFGFVQLKPLKPENGKVKCGRRAIIPPKRPSRMKKEPTEGPGLLFNDSDVEDIFQDVGTPEKLDSYMSTFPHFVHPKVTPKSKARSKESSGNGETTMATPMTTRARARGVTTPATSTPLKYSQTLSDEDDEMGESTVKRRKMADSDVEDFDESEYYDEDEV